MQWVVTFYMANRVAPRDWCYKLSRKHWAVALVINCSMVLLFQLSSAIPKPNFQQIILMLAIMAVAAMLFKVTLPRTEQSGSPTFQRSAFMDLLSLLTVGIFFFCATFLTFDPVKAKTSNVNATATSIVIGWTVIILALAMLIYRVRTRRSIPV